jgi:hypothetical protein
MKKQYIVPSLIALTAVAAVAGVSSTVLAANNFDMFRGNKIKGEARANLTDAQKAEMQTKLDAVKAALTAGDYNAWVTATKSINENSPALSKVNASNFADYVAKYKERETASADRLTKMDAVKAALDAGNYNAWVTATKALNPNCPNLQKITADNFSKYVEANKLREQADSIFKELGVNGGGFGERGEMKRGEGFGGMGMGRLGF